MPNETIDNFFTAIEQGERGVSAVKEMIEHGADVNAFNKREVVVVDVGGPSLTSIDTLPILSAMILGSREKRFNGDDDFRFPRFSRVIMGPEIDTVKLLLESGASVDKLSELPDFSIEFRPQRHDTYQISVGGGRRLGREDPLLYDGAELAKLLISNGAKNLNITVYPHFAKIRFLVAVYTPLAIMYQEDYGYRRNNTPEGLNNNVWSKVGEFDFLQQLEFLDSFSLSADEQRQIKDLIAANIENMTLEQKLTEMAYVVRNNKPTENIFSVISQNLLLAFDRNDIAADFSLEKFNDEFSSVYKKRIDNKAATLSNPETLQQVVLWCKDIVSAKEDAILTTQDLKYIFSIILLCACKDLKGAKEKFDAFSEKTANQWCILPLSNIIGSISNRKRPSH